MKHGYSTVFDLETIRSDMIASAKRIHESTARHVNDTEKGNGNGVEIFEPKPGDKQ